MKSTLLFLSLLLLGWTPSRGEDTCDIADLMERRQPRREWVSRQEAEAELLRCGQPAIDAVVAEFVRHPYIDIEHGNHTEEMRLLEKFGETALSSVEALLTDETLRDRQKADLSLLSLRVIRRISPLRSIPHIARAARIGSRQLQYDARRMLARIELYRPGTSGVEAPDFWWNVREFRARRALLRQMAPGLRQLGVAHFRTGGAVDLLTIRARIGTERQRQKAIAKLQAWDARGGGPAEADALDYLREVERLEGLLLGESPRLFTSTSASSENATTAVEEPTVDEFLAMEPRRQNELARELWATSPSGLRWLSIWLHQESTRDGRPWIGPTQDSKWKWSWGHQPYRDLAELAYSGDSDAEDLLRWASRNVSFERLRTQLLWALAHLDLEEARQLLLEMVEAPGCQLHGAQTLLGVGGPGGIDEAIDCLESDDESSRSRSLSLLQSATQQSLPFAWSAPVEIRREQVERWRAWWAAVDHAQYPKLRAFQVDREHGI